MERMAARVYCGVLLCLAGCWSSTEAAPGLNTGVCPSPLFGAVECTWIKFTSCVDDRDCTNNQKCCNNGCGLQCMDPVTENPGVCPMTNAELVRCVRSVDKLCADDSECPKNQKCCSIPCGGTRCIGPVTVKPGVCPKTKAELVRCSEKDDELCADDSECPKNQKCCGTACGGTRCTAPVTAKPGVCPKTNGNEEIRCVRKDDELCADDSECPKNEKCCGTACGGTRCTAPVTVKPGVCPKINSEIMCKRKDDKLCASDNECPKNQKCCGTPCGGTRCTAPVTVKPGVCPSRKYEPAECALIKFVSCANDRECANNQKCCSNGCGRQCMAPVTDVCGLPLVSGNCFAYIPMWGFNSAVGKCVSFVYGGCQGNGNRFDSQEECEDSCVRSAACRLPLDPGPCKAYMPMWGFDSAAGKCVRFVYGGCQGNGNRFNTQKECEESCGVRNVNPGVCPRRKYKPAMCPRVTFVSCVDDHDCASNEKCCNNGCGLQCMTAVTATPGFCPAKQYKLPMCFPSCADDSDCANKQRCCDNGCGFNCVDPVKVKPGVCPVRPKPWMCPLMNFMSCVDDNDCVNNEKCCSNGCGLDCMPPVTVKPGVCPLRKYDAAMCALIRLTPCVDDSECPNNEKCCSTGCGVSQCMVSGLP